MEDGRVRRLEAFCAGQFPEKEDIQIENWRGLKGGWESEIYAFDLCSGPRVQRECQGLVLRLYSGGSANEKASHEFRAMQMLHNAGYPVPQVYAISGIESPLERPFIMMDHIQGEPLLGLMLKASGKELQAWVELFCSLFTRLHALDWHRFQDADQSQAGDPYRFVNGWIRDARRALASSHIDEFSPVVDWIAQRRDRLACARPAPLHQDFHPDNILIRPNGEAVVIDWTAFTVSDPRFDLAWTLVLSEAYLGEAFRDAILHGYESQAGAPVAEMDAFEVFACARRLYDISVSLEHGAEQRGMRPEAVEAMKRDMPATRRVYERLVKHTGISMPRLEKMVLSVF
jgi:aminoglycoside phosphotransferase (APT) family kinase protein